MAQCDSGYLCSICGEPVAEIHESALYLRFVMGQVHPDALWTEPEQHLGCRPDLAQHIREEEFLAYFDGLEMSESTLDRVRLPEAERSRRDDLITRAYERLLTLPGGRHVLDYPLPDAEKTWSRDELGDHWKGSGL
jgi:hypothetical protein